MAMLMRKNHLENLPTEVKTRILQKLSPQDLCNVALVSKNLNAVALDPNLWPELTVNQHVLEKVKKEGIDSLLLRCNRFKKLKSLKIENLPIISIPPALWNNWSRLISKVAKLDISEGSLNKTKTIDIVKIAVQSKSIVELILDKMTGKSLGVTKMLPVKLLTKTFTKIKLFNLTGKDFETEQLREILELITKSKSLIELNLCGTNLEEAPKELLSKAISKLKKVDLSQTDLSTEQLVAIFEASIKSNSLVELNLRCLNEDSLDFEEVPKELLSKAICKLKTVILTSTHLSTEQLVAILEETVKSNSLIELDLSENTLNEVPTELLSDAVSKLEKVGLCATDLSTEQLIAVLEGTIKSNSPIELDLSGNNLKDVPEELLSKAVSKLKKLDLTDPHLTTGQLVAIFKATIKSNSLVELNLVEITLKEVPKELLAEAISKLKKVDLTYTDLSPEQLEAVLKATIKSNSVIELILSENSLKEVPTELLLDALFKLQKFDLANTCITTEQFVDVLEAIIKFKLPIKLNLSGNNLKNVPQELLSKIELLEYSGYQYDDMSINDPEMWSKYGL